jgi:zinc finger CCHC domain-containing protein 9
LPLANKLQNNSLTLNISSSIILLSASRQQKKEKEKKEQSNLKKMAKAVTLKPTHAKGGKFVKRSSFVKKPKMTKEQRREKYTNIARERRNKSNNKKKHTDTICYACRKRGHTISECPHNKNKGGSSSSSSSCSNANKKTFQSSICYKCGKSTCSLKTCPLLTKEEKKGDRLNYHIMDLPFATCFICGEKGHLASQCKLNKNGIYVNGGGKGGCKYCGANDHLFIHCPKHGKNKDELEDINDDDEASAGNVDEFLEEENSGRNTNSSNDDVIVTQKKKKKKKVVHF